MPGATSFAIGIVAHEKRLDQAQRLATLVGADVLMVDDATLKLGCQANHRRTWKALGDMCAEWSVVLEDDAVPVPDFRNQLGMALDATPGTVVSLYLGRQLPEYWQPAITTATTEADTADAHWITTDSTIHAVGLAIPTHLIPGLTPYLLGRLPADAAISQWARKAGHSTTYTWPSLVDHADQPTLIRQHSDGLPRPPGRVAWRTGTRHTWTNTTVHMPNPATRRTKQPT